MRPVKLTMSAFGSYADVQEIDFSELGTVYLITGETGSGKTTIFDAISFALFGKASGAARDDYLMLRSDFAHEKAKTYVELDFLSGESRYNIRRTIKKAGQDVSLILPDGLSISGERNIKTKITEIIGLDREQFSQIIMLAQNDFLRFLQNNTDERLKILRRIFGTESLRLFQEQLKSLVKRENENRALILRDFERHEVDVYKRDEIFAQWKLQIKSDKSKITDIEKELLVYDKQKQQLAAALAVAEELNKKFADLLVYRQLLSEHKTKADEIEKMKNCISRGEVSLYKVKPIYDDLQKTITNHVSAQTDLLNAQEQKTAADTELFNAIKHKESLPSFVDAQTAYNTLLKEWEIVSQSLKQLLALKTNYKEIARKQIVLNKTEEELAAVQDILENLPQISDCQAEFDNMTLELKDYNERLVLLLSLQKDFNIIVNKWLELEKEQAEFEKLHADFLNADRKHRELEEAFLRSQAGIIASSLTYGEPCPVCGSTNHPLPAVLSDDNVSEAKLIKAKEAKDNAGAKRETKASICSTLQTENETLSKRFISDISSIISDATITNPLLSENIEKVQAAIKNTGDKIKLAEKSLNELKDRFNKSTIRRDELTPQAASLQGEIHTLAKRFINDLSEFIPDITWESSQTRLDELLLKTQNQENKLNLKKEADKKSLDILTADWDAATKRKINAESSVLSAATLVNERIVNEQKLLMLKNDTQSKYEISLSSHGFLNETDYKAALVTENELAAFKKQISDYEKSGEQLSYDIKRLEKETEDKKQPDIVNLRTKAETADSESKILSEKRDEINGRLNKTESALKELYHAAALFEKSEKSYADVKQLSDTANGKLDFETYAQMAYFERVLRAANIRLRIMSQNRYTLLRKTDRVNARSRFGLDMEVMDFYTGKTRSANSLSGGESFMASLSLALGLSDVVGQSAGGVRLDAMFIDEGFGTLDVDVLELAIRTLSEMAGTNKTIGIISHVTELRERIDKQIKVEKTSVGSKIYLMV